MLTMPVCLLVGLALGAGAGRQAATVTDIRSVLAVKPDLPSGYELYPGFRVSLNTSPTRFAIHRWMGRLRDPS